MKKQRLAAIVLATVMSLCMLCQASLPAKAEEVKKAAENYKSIQFKLNNMLGQTPPLTDADLQVVKDAMGATVIENSARSIIDENTVFSVDWEASDLTWEDVRHIEVKYYWFTRDNTDGLVYQDSEGCRIWISIDETGTRTIAGKEGTVGDCWDFMTSSSAAQSEFSIGGDIMNQLVSSHGRKPDLLYIHAFYPAEAEDGSGVSDYMLNGAGVYYVINSENSPFHFTETLPEERPVELQIVPEVTDEVYVIGDGGGAVIKCTGELKDFVSIAIDDVVLSPSNYTVVSGSTVITIMSSYLDKLSVGRHRVTLNYTYGSVDTTLLVLDRDTGGMNLGILNGGNQFDTGILNGGNQFNAGSQGAESAGNENSMMKAPKTGDNANPCWPAVVLLLCSGGLVLVKRKAIKEVR